MSSHLNPNNPYYVGPKPRNVTAEAWKSEYRKGVNWIMNHMCTAEELTAAVRVSKQYGPQPGTPETVHNHVTHTYGSATLAEITEEMKRQGLST